MTTAEVGYLRTALIPLDELTPYPGNAKRGNVDAILASLRRNSQYRSLVVRELEHGPLIVLAGNHTMQALAAHGPGDCGQTTTTPDGGRQSCGICRNQPWEPAARVEIITCDDATARRINLADNKTAELGGYDTEALADLLTALDGDLEGTGYTHTDLDAILAAGDSEPLHTADLLAGTGDSYREQYAVMVLCGSEGEQGSVYAQLQDLGFDCKVVTT
ncbi:hypothetical protein [Nonomuraea sp. NPDC049646]|uniref:hypothetical protein n=1 Tax=unclassified Nonomuraea TaxID=2593643 RepID=UPI00379CD977